MLRSLWQGIDVEINNLVHLHDSTVLLHRGDLDDLTFLVDVKFNNQWLCHCTECDHVGHPVGFH